MRDSKNLVIGMLCAVVCIMAVAYAAFSTTLNVKTTVTVGSEWCMEISEASCTPTPQKGGVSEGVTATVKGHGEGSLTATIDMNFIQPGDYATCTVKFNNCGTLNAGLDFEVYSVVGNNEDEITYTNTTATHASENGNLTFTVSNLDNNAVLTPESTGHTVTVIGKFEDLADQGNANGESLSIRIKAIASQAA